MTITSDRILGTSDGHDVHLLEMDNGTIRVGFTDFGARLLSIEAPDRDGTRDHVLLGFDRVGEILRAGSFGAVLGRYANRIAGGRFSLDGTTYQLSTNDGANTLHGGKRSFSKQFWTVGARSGTSITFTLISPDGDQGFPGELNATVCYTLDGDTLQLDLTATVTKPCPVNLSAHPYFNLAGSAALDICDHDLTVFADTFLPTNDAQIPTGVLASVDGTPFDFRDATAIGSRIRVTDPQMLVARGIDHCFVIDGAAGQIRPAARLAHRATGRLLTVETDCAGLQVYTGNSLNGSLVGWGGTYRQTSGLALEAQAFPDAPNQPTFPSTVVRPGQTFRSATRFRFNTMS